MENETVRKVAGRAAILVVGIAALVAGGFGAIFLALIFGFGCGGSDVSEGSNAWICRGPREWVAWFALVGLGLIPPLLGTLASVARLRWLPLAIGVGAEAVVAVVALVLADQI